MTGSQYRNVIKRSLKKVDKENSSNYANAARQIFNNCGVAFPHGGYREVLQKLMTDDYMVWRSCTYKQAQECANAGIATVGVNSDHVVVIEPENDAVYVEDTADRYIENDGFADTVDSIDIEDRMDMQFFAYTLSPVLIMPMAATTTTTTTPRPPTNTGSGSGSGSSSNTTTTTTPKPPATINVITTTNTTITKTTQGTTVTPNTAPTKDGYAGMYLPTSNVTGVNGQVPRYAQMEPGPCLAYSVMMGDYNLHHQNKNAETFYGSNRSNYIDDRGYAKQNYYVDCQNFDRDELKRQLDSGKPVVVSGRTKNNTYDHFVLIVSYSGTGNSDSDYVVIDPLIKTDFLTTYDQFKNTYPNDTVQFKSDGNYYNYPMFVYK